MEEQDIPIDINTKKLLDWLVNRKHCKKNWQASILEIRTKINNAIQDMPVNEEITKLLTGTHINYFHCQKIVEILKETEADTKNIFGRYGSQRMKDWQEIIRLYERDNVYLPEAAQMLIRNVNYEVPGFKKQISKLDQMQTDLEKKEAEYKKSEKSANSEYQNLCKRLGIAGIKIKKELVEQIGELPNIYNELVEKVKDLNSVVEHYTSFVELTLGEQHNGGCVPMIKYILDKGNTTTYEWTYGERPLFISEPSISINLDDDEMDDERNYDENKDENVGIDYSLAEGGIDLNLDMEGAIDFGSGGEEEYGGADIDWGEDDLASPEGEIDFDITLEESGIVVESAGNEGGNATGAQALTILDNKETRNDFINQLFELEAFLKLRLYEFTSNSNRDAMDIGDMHESRVIQNSSLEDTQRMLDSVQLVLSEMLVDGKVQHLHNIKHSPRYVEALAATLRQKKKLIRKMERLQREMRAKQEETRQRMIKLQPTLKLIIEKTRELQADIESDISRRYRNRLVRLTGAINTL